MLLTTEKSRRWRRWTVGMLVLLTAGYALYARGEFPHGGSLPGLALGVLALLLVGVLLYYGVRKRRYRGGSGSLETWLQSHLYLGVLSLFVVLFHSGFRFEDDMAVAAFAVLVLVVLTGLFGAVLYTTLPRVLTEVQGDASPEEVSDDVHRLRRSMARLAEGRSATFRRIRESLDRELEPREWGGWRLVLRPVRRREASGDWTELLRRVEPDEQEDLREMLVRSRQAKELLQRLRLQQRYKNLMEAWLYLHVPLSLGLVVLVAAHVVAVVYYRGWAL